MQDSAHFLSPTNWPARFRSASRNAAADARAALLLLQSHTPSVTNATLQSGCPRRKQCIRSSEESRIKFLQDNRVRQLMSRVSVGACIDDLLRARTTLLSIHLRQLGPSACLSKGEECSEPNRCHPSVAKWYPSCWLYWLAMESLLTAALPGVSGGYSERSLDQRWTRRSRC